AYTPEAPRHGALDEWGEVLPARDPDRIAQEPPSQRGPGARVRPVEGEIGFVRSELVLVVGEVDPPVELYRYEDRVGDDPCADPVVPPLVGEQELVGRLVHEDGEA